MAGEAYPLRLAERETVKSAISDIERQLSDLKTDPVSPGPVEVRCHRLLEQLGLRPQPLHLVIAELMSENDARKQQWLAQAHNLLFAPVLPSTADGDQAASEFARQQLPVPVFTLDALKQAVQQPESTLLGAAAGYQSLAVQSLLNPALMGELKQQLKMEAAQHHHRLNTLEQDIVLFAPELNRYHYRQKCCRRSLPLCRNPTPRPAKRAIQQPAEVANHSGTAVTGSP